MKNSIMHLSEIISLVSAFLVVIGWLVNGHLNRRQDIGRMRTQYRIEGLKTFLRIYPYIRSGKLPDEGTEERRQFFKDLDDFTNNYDLYTYPNEYVLLKKFIYAWNHDGKVEPNMLLDISEELKKLVNKQIRKELGLKEMGDLSKMDPFFKQLNLH